MLTPGASAIPRRRCAPQVAGSAVVAPRCSNPPGSGAPAKGARDHGRCRQSDGRDFLLNCNPVARPLRPGRSAPAASRSLRVGAVANTRPRARGGVPRQPAAARSGRSRLDFLDRGLMLVVRSTRGHRHAPAEPPGSRSAPARPPPGLPACWAFDLRKRGENEHTRHHHLIQSFHFALLRAGFASLERAAMAGA